VRAHSLLAVASRSDDIEAEWLELYGFTGTKLCCGAHSNTGLPRKIEKKESLGIWMMKLYELDIVVPCCSIFLLVTPFF